MAKLDIDSSIAFELLTISEGIEHLREKYEAIYEEIGHAQFMQGLCMKEFDDLSKRLRKFYEEHREYLNLGD